MFNAVEQKQTDAGFEAENGLLIKELKELIAAGNSSAAAPAESMPEITISPEMTAKFVQEADELLENVEQILLDVEKTPTCSPDRIREAFRGIHSLKGNCGFMGLADLGKLSHKAEKCWSI
jgi:two-component system chemotaxis sensor kinase CheA